MIVFSGGTGTPKLIRGFMEIILEEDISVVVNTAEDTFVSGSFVTPDIDTILYLFSGILNEERWWGICDDTFKTSQMLEKLGFQEILPLSEIDRAVCIARTELLNSGKTLTEATQILAERLNIEASIYPMTDGSVKTMITTGEDEVIHFQEFWLGRKGKPDVKAINVEFEEGAKISESLMKEFAGHKSVLIGPSNPISSIGPILKVPIIRDLLKEKYVVAVSPFLGDEAISGPAGKFMRACNLKPGSFSVFEMYKDIIDVFIIDEKDYSWDLKKYKIAEDAGIDILKTNTIMNTKQNSIELAEFILDNTSI